MKRQINVKKHLCLVLILGSALVLFCSGVVSAQNELIIYPKNGQSQEQQEQDKFQCYTWAKGQSGFDPMAPPTASTPPPQAKAKKGGVVRGAAGGALLGVAVGAISGNAGKGAAIGAVSGGAVGGVRRNNQVNEEKQAEQQWAQKEGAKYSQERNGYNRAFAACMEGRDYTVK